VPNRYTLTQNTKTDRSPLLHYHHSHYTHGQFVLHHAVHSKVNAFNIFLHIPCHNNSAVQCQHAIVHSTETLRKLAFAHNWFKLCYQYRDYVANVAVMALHLQTATIPAHSSTCTVILDVTDINTGEYYLLLSFYD